MPMRKRVGMAPKVTAGIDNGGWHWQSAKVCHWLRQCEPGNRPVRVSHWQSQWHTYDPLD